MATKPNAKDCLLKEQIIDGSEVSGLTMMLTAYPNGGSRLRVCSDALPFGNRDFIFGPTGEFGGTGTATGGCCMSWLSEVRTPEEMAEHDRRVEAMDGEEEEEG